MLSEASYEMTEQAMRSSDSRRKGDENLLVVFSEEPIQDKEESVKAGRPIYKNREMVMIMVPGDKDSVIHRLATDDDRERFPKQYAAFLNKKSQETASGTPLKAVSFLTAAQVKELEFFNIYTVEQLANTPDSNMKFMGFHMLKQLAQDFLKAAEGMAPITELRDENEKLRNQLAEQTKAVTELSERLQKLQEKLLEKFGEEED